MPIVDKKRWEFHTAIQGDYRVDGSLLKAIIFSQREESSYLNTLAYTIYEKFNIKKPRRVLKAIWYYNSSEMRVDKDIYLQDLDIHYRENDMKGEFTINSYVFPESFRLYNNLRDYFSQPLKPSEEELLVFAVIEGIDIEKYKSAIVKHYMDKFHWDDYMDENFKVDYLGKALTGEHWKDKSERKLWKEGA